MKLALSNSAADIRAFGDKPHRSPPLVKVLRVFPLSSIGYQLLLLSKWLISSLCTSAYVNKAIINTWCWQSFLRSSWSMLVSALAKEFLSVFPFLDLSFSLFLSIKVSVHCVKCHPWIYDPQCYKENVGWMGLLMSQKAQYLHGPSFSFCPQVSASSELKETLVSFSAGLWSGITR